jgi:hypothetical protein
MEREELLGFEFENGFENILLPTCEKERSKLYPELGLRFGLRNKI